MRGVGPINVRGRWYLVGGAVLVFAVWLWAMSAEPWEPDGTFSGRYLVVSLGVSAILAGGAVLIQLWSWRRQGGRLAVAEVDSWVRSGAVPAEVPREQWQPALERRTGRAAACWSQVVLGVGLLVLLGVEAFTDPGSQDDAWHVPFAVVWAVLVAVNLVEVRWRIPRIRRMAADAWRVEQERLRQPAAG
jgi:hypothetical protein